MNRAGYMAPIGELISESLRSVKTRVFSLRGNSIVNTYGRKKCCSWSNSELFNVGVCTNWYDLQATVNAGQAGLSNQAREV